MKKATRTEPDAPRPVVGPKPDTEARSPEREVLADRLHSAAIHLLRRLRQTDVAIGEGPARLSALSVLVFGGSKTLGELARAEQVKPSTMSRMVAGLVRSRLVGITPDRQDARRLRICATAKGTRLLNKGRRLRIATLATQLDSLAPEQLARLGEAVAILHGLLATWNCSGPVVTPL
jgi:DNA-binding MarR family transcriptional regulator